MQRKYADRDLVAISVSLDDVKDTKVRAKVDEFLRKQGATFANYVLDAGEGEWQDLLKINALPCVYVFNRDNQFVLKLVEEKVDYAEIEKKVQELLQQ
jgi:hypothetical protein